MAAVRFKASVAASEAMEECMEEERDMVLLSASLSRRDNEALPATWPEATRANC